MTTRTLPGFTFITPTTIEEAVSFLDRYREKARILAGGTDTLVLMKKGVASPEALITLGNVKGLDRIKYDKNGLTMGPLTTIRDMETSETIRDKYPLLAEAARSFGTVQIQNMATVGGNICNASPAGDMIPPLLVMDAETDLVGNGGRRTIKLRDFFTGPGESVMKSNEILVELRALPLPSECGSCFVKIGRTAEDLSKVSVAVILSVAQGRIKDARLSLGSVAPTPIRALEAESFLEGKETSGSVIDKAATMVCNGIAPITDCRSTAEYRREITRVIIKRAITKALERVGGK
jgi:carbon-monoxide dehydrogenase medium subunit